MISVVTLISPISLSNGKFLGCAIPIMVTFTMFENLFQDWDTGMKKGIKILKTIFYHCSGTQEDNHGSTSREHCF